MVKRNALVVIGFILGGVFWVADATVDHLLFRVGGTLREPLLSPDAHEVYVRCLVWVMLTAFGAIAQALMRYVYRAEREKEHEHRQFEQLFSEMPAGFALCEAIFDENDEAVDYRILAANPASEELVGLPADHVVGKTVREVLPNIESYWIRGFCEVARSGKPARFESYLQDAGKFFSVSAYCPEPGRFAMVFTDVTEQRRSEEALAWEVKVNQAVADLSKTLIEKTSVEDISAAILDQAKTLTGSSFGYVGHIDPPTGHLVCTTMTRDIWDACQVPDKSIVFEAFSGLWGWVLDNKQPLLTNTPNDDPRSSGTPEGHLPIERFLSVPSLSGDLLLGQISLANSSRPYTQRDLELLQRLATLYAVSIERHRAMEERRVLESQIQHAQKMESLGLLAGGVAHDFNNLLVGILGNASLALMDLPAESPIRPTIQHIETAAQRAADLTNQLLAYSGKGRFVVQPLDLSRLVEEMSHLLESAIPKRIRLSYSFAPKLSAIEGDATQIRQVIMNLITNAAEAIGDESGQISITTGQQTVTRDYLQEMDLQSDLDEGPYVFAEVSDSGCGMDEETKVRLFEPFFSTKFTGRGLGLAAVQGIVHGHRGAIKVYSERGQGTTIKVLLPASDQMYQSETPTENGDDAWACSGLVLVIDDEKTVRDVAAGMLSHAGFDVLTAGSGREGLEVFRDHADAIQLVLLDMTMPDMSGEEVYREMRGIPSDARVILSSGYNEQEVTSRFAGKGLAGFIQKPYQAFHLLKTVRQVLDSGT